MRTTFIDSGREPKCQPDPAFPTGKDVDLSFGSTDYCTVSLPYPAPRCGLMVTTCDICGLSIAVTVAGRVDDPRTLKMACKQSLQ